jgi:hypothetical protein
MSPNSDHPVCSPFYLFDIDDIYKFWLSELITHINYPDIAKLETQKAKFYRTAD